MSALPRSSARRRAVLLVLLALHPFAGTAHATAAPAPTARIALAPTTHAAPVLHPVQSPAAAPTAVAVPAASSTQVVSATQTITVLPGGRVLSSTVGTGGPGGTGGARRPPQTAALSEAGVTVTMWSAWPDMLYQGHQPIAFELVNATEEERRVTLGFSRGWNDDRWQAHEEVLLAPRARERRSVFVPVWRFGDSDYQIEVRCGGDRTYLSNVGAQQPPDLTRWPVIYAHGAARTPQAGATEVWASALSGREPPGAPHTTASSGAHRVLHGLGYVGPSAVPAPATTSYGVTVTAVDLDELPASFEPYTSLKGVVLDAESPLPRKEVLDALLQWTRLGGCLVLQGPNAAKRVDEIPGAAAWQEERFVLHSATTSDHVYACGQGTLVVAASRDLQELAVGGEHEFTGVIEAIGHGLVAPVPFVGSPHHDDVFAKTPPMPGLDLPYRALTLLLVLFAIVIGPVNLIVVKKLNRPALLLLTVPVIALVFSLGLFAYGALAQGLDTRALSLGLTWLDQRAHTAATLEVRSLFAGMPAGDGWRPGPGAACVALPRYTGNRVTGQLELDFRDGVTYGGDYLPVRREVRNAFLVDRAARGRLEVTVAGDTVTVENALGADVEALVLRDASGGWHVLEGALASGAKRALRPEPNANVALDGAKVLLGELKELASTTTPFPGTYVARLARSAFTDACGIEYAEEGSTHVVFGILDAAGGGR